MEKLDIYDILEQCDRRHHAKIVHNSLHLLQPLIPKGKEYSKTLRPQSLERPEIMRKKRNILITPSGRTLRKTMRLWDL